MGKLEPANPRLETVDCLDARLVELDLLEQAINAGRDMNAYKLQRLADLKVRLSKAQERENKEPSIHE